MSSPLRWITSMLCLLTCSLIALAEPVILADMEDSTAYKLFGTGEKPTAQLTRVMASTGQRSLRVAYTGGADDNASIVFPLAQSVAGLDTLVFDIFCEADNGATLVVTVHQKVPDPANQAAYFKTRFLLGSFVDDWTTLRLPTSSAMRFVSKGDFKPDWSQVDKISFTLSGGMNGKAVFYLDNLAADVSRQDASPNLIYNSSFERATNPDLPDGWRRDFNQPPFDSATWALVGDGAYDGEHCLRTGKPGKYATSWGQFSQIISSQVYTCSAWLRAAEGTRVQLYAAGIDQQELTVGPEWERFWLTGEARYNRTQVRIQLLEGGPLWIDAVQLEPSAEPTPYHPNPVDVPTPEGEKPAEAVIQWKVSKQDTIAQLDGTPTLDGQLNDPCWQKVKPLGDFRQLTDDQPAAQRTEVRYGFTHDALYIAIEAFDDDMAAVREHLAARPRGPWGTDLIELFVDVGRTGQSYYQLVANPRDDQYQSWFVQPKRSGERSCLWESAGALGDKSWTLEVMIPLASLARLGETPGPELGINVCRTNPRTDTYSSWVYMDGNFHRPQRFGSLTGFTPDWGPFQWQVSGLSAQAGIARCLLRNNTGMDRRLTLHFVAELGVVQAESSPITIDIPAGESKAIRQRLPITRDGTYRLTLRGSGPAGELLVASQPANVSIGGASALQLLGTHYDLYTDEPAAEVRARVGVPATKLVWRLRKDGVVLSQGELSPTQGATDWSIPLANVPDGSLQLEVELPGEPAIKATSHFRKAPAAASLVRVDRWGQLLQVNGKPFFPYGFFDETVSRNDLAIWPAVLDNMASIGCNTALVYAGNNPAVHQRLKAFLDEAAKRDIKLWIHLSGFFAWWSPRFEKQKQRYQTETEAKAALAEVVGSLRDHPALLGWCTLDEPGNHPALFTAERAKDYYEQVKAVDPYHPVIFSHLNQLGDYETYGRSTDLALIPFLARGGRYDQLFQEFSANGLPVITNTPCYGAAGSRDREPTPPEQRAALYKSLLLGSSGLLTYLYRPASERVWQEYQQLGKEAKVVVPLLRQSEPADSFDILPASNDLLATFCRDGEQTYLIAVNVSPKPIDAVFTLLDRRATDATHLFGAGPAVALKDNQIQVTMPGQSSLALHLETKAP